MSKKERFEKFVEDHKVAIAYFTGATAATIGVMIGLRIRYGKPKYVFDVRNDAMAHVLESAVKFDKPNVFSGITTTPLDASKLGKLGEAIVEAGGTNEITFTHFIAIGEAK